MSSNRWNRDRDRWTPDDQYLRNFSANYDQRYSHSSLRGGRDRYTPTGRLSVPDVPEVQSEMHRIMVKKFTENRPLCWVEMHTPLYPFYEDIDVIGTSRQEDGPPESLLMNSREFWNLRAEILHELFPDVQQLELTLYKASGWNVQKCINKASFHTVWRQLIVDEERAEAVRKTTVLEFERRSARGPLADLARRLRAVNEANTWNGIFDITVVRGGSCRMPFNDKVVSQSGEPEGRPILPVGVWTFDFGRNGVSWFQQVYSPGDLRAEEWLARGTVRIPPEKELTTFRPLKSGWKPATNIFEPSPFSSHRTRQSKNNNKKKKSQGEKWEAEQRRRRRKFRGTPQEFKRWIDWLLWDPQGYESTLLETQHRDRKKWRWSSKKLKGAIEIAEDGEVFIQGNETQQKELLQLVRQFTEEWTGPTPKATPKVLQNLERRRAAAAAGSR